MSSANGGTNVAVSTVKALHLANQAGQRVFKATSANYAAVRNQLINWPASLLNQFQTAVNGGAELLLPANGQLTLNRWQGSGYVLNGVGAIGMIISGNYYGGFGTNSLIKEIESVHGKKLIFTYSVPGRLDLITDAFNRTLSFTYSNNLLRAVTDSHRAFCAVQPRRQPKPCRHDRPGKQNSHLSIRHQPLDHRAPRCRSARSHHQCRRADHAHRGARRGESFDRVVPLRV